MNILIIGGTSMVGKRLCARLRAGGHQVVTAGRSSREDYVLSLGCANDPGENIAGIEVDTLVHCAASFAGNRAGEMIENEIVNAVGALRVAQIAERTGCQHVVYLSTLFAYRHLQNGYFGSYALSKAHGQENLQWYCQNNGTAFTALLPTQLYDEQGEARRHQGLLYHVIDCVREGREVHFFGQNDPLRNFLFVEDLVTMIERVVEGRICGEFPCVFPQSLRLSEIARMTFAAFGKEPRVFFDPKKPDLPTVYVPNGSDAYQRIGYTPATSLPAGLALIRQAVGG